MSESKVLIGVAEAYERACGAAARSYDRGDVDETEYARLIGEARSGFDMSIRAWADGVAQRPDG